MRVRDPEGEHDDPLDAHDDVGAEEADEIVDDLSERTDGACRLVHRPLVLSLLSVHGLPRRAVRER